jgi:hypothetical protein
MTDQRLRQKLTETYFQNAALALFTRYKLVRLLVLWGFKADSERSRVFLEWWNWGRDCTNLEWPHFWRRPERLPVLDPAFCMGRWE